VRILAISGGIPYETLTFSPDFPESMRERIVTSMQDFSQSDAWSSSLGYYGYDSLMLTSDADYDSSRAGLDGTDLTLEGVYGPQ
jgi:ABC-type phosphate/phosphonate transport system substrate-binding protein